MSDKKSSLPPKVSSRSSVKFKGREDPSPPPPEPPATDKKKKRRSKRQDAGKQNVTPSEPTVQPRFYKDDRRPTIEPPADGQASYVPPMGMDKLNTEYFYYTVALREMLPLMSRVRDKKHVLAWVDKLTSPAYQTFPLREKRNKYLIKLCLTVINDEAYDVFSHLPPVGILPPVENIVKDPVPARWEMDTFWSELLRDLPVDWGSMGCSVHDECGENRDETGKHPMAGLLLDQEFKFFLYLARPFTMLVDSPADQAKLCLWLQTLGRVRPSACLAMKGIRNDYMQALLGYIQDLRVTGPFKSFPPLSQPLPPLNEFIKLQNEEGKMTLETTKPLTDPTNPLVESFLDSQPKPENGAFCYIAITGQVKDLTASPQSASLN